MELRMFKGRKAELEAELQHLQAEVTELRVRHVDEVTLLKRDFDLRQAALSAQVSPMDGWNYLTFRAMKACLDFGATTLPYFPQWVQRIEEMERSVDER